MIVWDDADRSSDFEKVMSMVTQVSDTGRFSWNQIWIDRDDPESWGFVADRSKTGRRHVHRYANQNWPYREHLDLEVFLQAAAFSWHICQAVYSGHGDLDDIFKIFAFGAIAQRGATDVSAEEAFGWWLIPAGAARSAVALTALAAHRGRGSGPSGHRRRRLAGRRCRASSAPARPAGFASSRRTPGGRRGW